MIPIAKNNSDINTLSPEEKQKTSYLIRRIYSLYVHSYLGTILLASFFMIVAAALTGAVAQLFKPVLDTVMQPGNIEYILPIALAFGGTFILRGIVSYIHTLMMNKASQSIIADIQNTLFRHFMRMDLYFFHQNPSGHLISRVINDVNIMRMAITDTMTGLIKSSFTLLFLLGVMFYQDWVLACFAIFVFPFAAAFVAHLGKKLRRVAKTTQIELGNLSDRLSQTFLGVRQVKAYNAEDKEKRRAGEAIERVRKLSIKALRIGTLSTPVNELLIGITVFAIIVYGGHQIHAGQMTAGELGAFIAAFTLAYEPMKRLAKLNNNLQSGLGAAERVFEILDTTPQIQQKPDAIEKDFHQPEITFENITFHYPESHINAVEDVSFQMEPGSVTALVGPSGSGKSTILNLIPRFYDVRGGSIRIDGYDIRDLTLYSLRKNIALVSQDITIFDDSVFANIAYGTPQASEEDVINAAKMAAAHEFIENMPEGYETRVGENGVKLSGGQKQRLSIARAVLSRAPILLLDEATSALDSESEQLIQQSLAQLQKGRTTLVIAHRLSTIQNADNIIVLESGRLVESGRHTDLLSRQDGIYARMHRKLETQGQNDF